MDTILAAAQETLQPRPKALPSEVLFEGCLSSPVKITLQQLAALADDTQQHATPPLSLPRLASLTGRSASTLRVHLAILRAYRSAVRLQRAGHGCFTLVLADWLFLPLPGLPEERISHPNPENVSPPPAGQALPAACPDPPKPAASLLASPQTGRDSLPAATVLPDRKVKPTLGAATDPLPPIGTLPLQAPAPIQDARRDARSGSPLNGSPALDPAAPKAKCINILRINQEEEVDLVLKTTEDLPPPPNHNNITTPVSGADPPVSPGCPALMRATAPSEAQAQAGSDLALPKTGSKAHRAKSRKAAAQRSAMPAGPPPENLTPPARIAGEKDKAASPTTQLSLAVRQALEDSGVFRTLFSEVAHAGWSDEELLALMAWCRADNPKKPGGLFMVRLRSGLNPPESYYSPPCPNCGRTGGEHASDCSQRYITGPYASFVKH